MPEGLKIVPFLDRSELIARTTDTVASNLIEGALIVIFPLVILLGSFRGGLITATTIPLALLFAFILMKQFGVWATLMSVRSEEHTSELQSRPHLVCRLLLEKKNKT